MNLQISLFQSLHKATKIYVNPPSNNMNIFTKKAIIPCVDVLILTPISVEYNAIRKMLLSILDFTDPHFKRTYCLGNIQTKTQQLKIALRKTGKGRPMVAEGTQQGIALFQPQIVILFGTAGGIKKVKIGDVIVGTGGYDYEAGRVVEGGFHSTPRSLDCTQRLVELAEKKTQQKDWLVYLPEKRTSVPNIIFSPIASGDKVITTYHTPILTQLTERYNDALALEMESYAFLHSARNYPTVETLIIRGVSDMLADKTVANQHNSRELAVTNAAAFLRHFLESKELLLANPKSKKRPFALILVGLFAVSFFVVSSFLLKVSNKPPLSQYHATIDTFQQGARTAPPKLSETASPIKVPKEPKEPPPPSVDTILERSVDTSTVDADEVILEEPTITSEENTPEAITEETSNIEETYLYNIYIFQPDGLLMTQSIMVDGTSRQILGNEILLTKGEHHIRIHYKSNQVYETTIQVVPENTDKVIYIELP